MHPLNAPDLFRLLLHFLIPIGHVALLRAVLHTVMKGEWPRGLREDLPVLFIVIGTRARQPLLIYRGNEIFKC